MPIDLRSDTVTRPSAAMRQAMAEALVGDDVYGDDPTVNALERQAAKLLGFEAALFCASGTQANLVAILAHCQRGDEYLVGQQAHTYKYEAGGAAVFGSVQPQPIDCLEDATLPLESLAEKVKPDDIHFARTRLLCLENTHNGKALPLDYLEKAADFAAERGLALHLDGARLMNAAVSQSVSAKSICRHFDSATLCLSKGLGAPVGSLVFGNQSFIAKTRKWRKMAGGGMRQAGILAAAGIFALNNNIQRLTADHENAKRLAAGLQEIPGLSPLYHPAQTNMVFVKADPTLAAALADFLATCDILISPGPTTRLVTHLDISEEDVDYVIAKVEEFVKKSKQPG